MGTGDICCKCGSRSCVLLLGSVPLSVIGCYDNHVGSALGGQRHGCAAQSESVNDNMTLTQTARVSAS